MTRSLRSGDRQPEGAAYGLLCTPLAPKALGAKVQKAEQREKEAREVAKELKDELESIQARRWFGGPGGRSRSSFAVQTQEVAIRRVVTEGSRNSSPPKCVF